MSPATGSSPSPSTLLRRYRVRIRQLMTSLVRRPDRADRAAKEIEKVFQDLELVILGQDSSLHDEIQEIYQEAMERLHRHVRQATTRVSTKT